MWLLDTPRDPQELLQELTTLSPIPVSLFLHRNRSCYATAEVKRGTLYLSLHEFFLRASPVGLKTVLSFGMKGDRRSRAELRQMAHLALDDEKIPPPVTQPKGEVYDLELFLPPDANVAITWFSAPPHRTFRSITFGSYDRAKRLIRINRLLDNPAVPPQFLSYLVYHEYLHALIPPRLDARGRLISHPPEFRKQEASYPHFALAKEWEKGALTFFRKQRKSSYGRP